MPGALSQNGNGRLVAWPSQRSARSAWIMNGGWLKTKNGGSA